MNVCFGAAIAVRPQPRIESIEHQSRLDSHRHRVAIECGNPAQVLAAVEHQRGITLPMSPFFRSDPYRTLTDGLQSAYVIGRVDIDGKTYHHLAFTEADSEWQLWVEGVERPVPRRAQVIYKTLPREPRMVVDFSDWNFSRTIANDFFAFSRPKDATAVSTVGTSEVKQ